MKLDTLKKKMEQGQASRNQFDKEIGELNSRSAALDAEMQSVAESGAVDLYLRLKQSREKLDAELYVKTIARDKALPVFDDAVIMDAWSEYAGQHDKQLVKMLEKYNKARHDIFLQFMEIIRFQNDALREREIVGTMAAHDAEAGVLHGDSDSRLARFSLVQIGEYGNAPELRFFQNSGDASDEDMQLMTSVIRFHNPK